MEFSRRLAALRKERGLTQKALSEQVGVHITQTQRYENGSIQPTLDVLRRLAVALSVSADLLVFDKDERGPDEDLKLEFEALNQFDAEEKAIVKKVLQGLIIQHQAKRWSQAASS
ncbi:MAG: helix-turn-helix transcriptional regulator [Candidatus Thiodiazotropha sp. (ex Lucinoma kastoroae)]|nr:helix-turn-helix transcriptional regulator [Candidatus Thiodiazotropha sp. (ex Lucinoma kastoroae)]